MELKHIIVGAVAAFTSASVARAADAVVIPEPEPEEYVQICDDFGDGFFFIPGTETCLRIGGSLKYQVGITSDNGETDTPNFFEYEPDTWNKETSAHIDVEARSETEWGELVTLIGVDAGWSDPSDGPAVVDEAWISLGGLRMGFADSAWAEDTSDDISSGGSHSDGGLWFGDEMRHVIQYSVGGEEGFYGMVSLEDDEREGDGYMPDIVGFASYQGGWGRVWGRVGYDESLDGFGASIGTHLYVPNMPESSFRLIGFYADGDHQYGTGSSNAIITDEFGNSEWSVLASYFQQFTPIVSGSVGFQYFDSFYEPLSSVKTNVDGYAAEVSLVVKPVENLEIRSEVQYDKIDALGGSVSGFLWLKREF